MESVKESSVGSSIPTIVTDESKDIVTFKTRGVSWVEVTDAKGVVQLRKSLAAGELVATSGALPLAVVVGKADLTDVMVRGKPFPIDELAKDNVARFEVK
jgi:cytoskeleton protein RodZ